MGWTTAELGSLAWAQLWQVTLVALTVAFAALLIGRRRPHLAHVLWLVVLIKCVTPPLITAPSGLFCWMQPSHAVNAQDESIDSVDSVDTLDRSMNSLASGDSLSVNVAGQGANHVLKRNDGSLKGVAAAPWLPAGSPSTLAAPTRRMSSHSVLTVIWLAGGVLIALVSCARWCCFLHELRTTPRTRDPDLDRFVKQLAEKLGVRRHVRVVITHGRLGPAIIGVFRPVLLLPHVVVQGKAPHEMEPILAHELIHLRRGDLWVGLLQVCVQALWWFHPLMWLINRWVTRDAEQCCDEEVVGELGCDPACYARSLIDVLELKQTLKPVPVFPGVRPVEVTSMRLERIMKLGQGCLKRTPWWCWLVMITAALTLLPGGAFVASAKDKHRQKSPQTSPIADRDVSTRSYKAGDLLRSIEKTFQIKGDPAKAFLLDQVLSNCAGVWFETARFKAIHASREADPLKQPSNQDPAANLSVAWNGKKLVVQQDAAGHRQIAQALQTLRENGWRQWKIEAMIVTGPKDDMAALSSQWTIPQSPNDHSSSDASPALSRHPIGQNSARSSIEKRIPVMVEVLDNERREAILGKLEQNQRVNVLHAPKLVTFNGQPVTINDSTQRPFVIGVHQGASQLQVVESGLRVQLKSTLQPESRLRLDYQIQLTQLLGVESRTIRADGKSVKIQIPEVEKSEISSSAEMQSGQTLLVGGLKAKQPQREKQHFRLGTQVHEDQSLVVLMRVTRVESDRDASAAFRHNSKVNSDAGIVGEIAAPERSSQETTASLSETQQKVAALVREFNMLMGEQRFAEAEIIAKQGLAASPKSKVLQAMQQKATATHRVHQRSNTPSRSPSNDQALPDANQPRSRIHREGLGRGASQSIPSDDEVMKALWESERESSDLSLVEKDRNDVRIVKEKIADYVDRPRFMPLIGPTQLHHQHFKCTIYFTESTRTVWPLPHVTQVPKQVVIYVDQTNLVPVTKPGTAEEKKGLESPKR